MTTDRQYEVAFTISTGTTKGVRIKDAQYTLPLKAEELWALHDAIMALVRNWKAEE